MPTNTEGFSYQRLIKLLGMTTSPNDGEALVAIRKANAELDRLGKTWAEFIMSKITVVADPFGSVPDLGFASSRTTTAYAPPRPQPQPRPRPTTPPPLDLGSHAADIVARYAPQGINLTDMIRKLRMTTGADLVPAKTAIEAAVRAWNAARPAPQPQPKPDPWASTSGTSQTTRTNQFAGICSNCKERVGPQEGQCFESGKLSSGKIRWSVQHLPGQCPQKAKSASAPKVNLDDLNSIF